MIEAAGLSEWSPTVWVDPLVVVALLSAAGAGAAWMWRKVLRPLVQMATDWHGTPERPGVAARPGVMQRLQTGDDRMTRIEHRLDEAAGHGCPVSGARR